MTLFKAALLVPAIASGAWLVKTGAPVEALKHVSAVAAVHPHEEDPALNSEPSTSQSALDSKSELEEESESKFESRSSSNSRAKPNAKPNAEKSELDANLNRRPASSSGSRLEATAQGPKQKVSPEDIIVQRRMRIERILMTLDFVAEAALQMEPENADRIEPVVVDLAEQTLGLVDDGAVAEASADDELQRIEETVEKLVGTLELMVEPEMSL